MPQTIEVPGIGPVEFPDGMTDEQIVAAIKKTTAKPEKGPDPSAGGGELRPFGISTGIKTPEWLDRGLAGGGKALVDTKRGVSQLLGLTSQEEIDENKRLDAPLMDTTAGTVGNVLGNIAQSVAIPGGTTIKGAALAGGLLAGAQPVATGESRGLNATVGAGAGAGGATVAKALGAALRGPQNVLTPAERELAAKAKEFGIDLRPGQATGNKFLKTIESQMERMPATSAKATQRTLDQGQQFTRAVAKQMGSEADEVGEATMSATKKRLGAEFDELFKGETIKVLDTTLDKLGSVSDEAIRFLPAEEAKIVINRIDDFFAKVNAKGGVDGVAYQKWRSDVHSKNGDVNHYLKQVKAAVDEAATASLSAAKMERFGLANKQYKNMKTIQPLAEKSTTGQVSPGALLERVRASNPNMAFGQGGEMADLGRIGKAFLKDGPDSGTSGRVLAQQLLQGGMAPGVGAGAYIATGDAETALKMAGTTLAGQVGAPKLAQALMNNPAVAAYLTKGGIPAGAVDQRLIEALLKGTAGAPVAAITAARN